MRMYMRTCGCCVNKREQPYQPQPSALKLVSTSAWGLELKGQVWRFGLGSKKFVISGAVAIAIEWVNNKFGVNWSQREISVKFREEV